MKTAPLGKNQKSLLEFLNRHPNRLHTYGKSVKRAAESLGKRGLIEIFPATEQMRLKKWFKINLDFLFLSGIFKSFPINKTQNLPAMSTLAIESTETAPAPALLRSNLLTGPGQIVEGYHGKYAQKKYKIKDTNKIFTVMVQKSRAGISGSYRLALYTPATEGGLSSESFDMFGGTRGQLTQTPCNRVTDKALGAALTESIKMFLNKIDAGEIRLDGPV